MSLLIYFNLKKLSLFYSVKKCIFTTDFKGDSNYCNIASISNEKQCFNFYTTQLKIQIIRIQ